MLQGILSVIGLISSSYGLIEPGRRPDMKIPTRLVDICGYVFCVLGCKFAVVSASGMTASLIYIGGSMLGVHYASRPDVFYAANWLCFTLSVGALVGFFVYRAWRSAFSWFVWLPSGVLLLHRIVIEPRSVLFGAAGNPLAYFFSAGCKEISLAPLYISVRCSDQFQYSLPFYAAIGFSFGAWLSYLHLRLTLSQPKDK